MKYKVEVLQEELYSMIRRIGERPEQYARNPGQDFTRRRALTPALLIYLILTMDEKSIWKGLLGHFQKKIDTPSASAFVQQRHKLLPSAFEDLFHCFTDFLRPQKRFRGYRLLAVDGSSLKSEAYPTDSEAYCPGTEYQHGWNLFHIHALYDMENRIYTDVIVQKEHTKHESKALCQMTDRSGIAAPVILLADRNYEAYNNFAHLEKKGWRYLIRLKDSNRKNAYGVTLPDQREFDLPVRIPLGRLTERQLRQRGLPVPERYCRIPNHMTFDYLGPESEDLYTFSARIVRLKLAGGNTQMLITNLDPAQFPLPELKVLYAKRWGIETSFRELKYTVGLIHLHSRKSDLVLQEIYAAFTIFNFAQAVSWSVDEDGGRSKYQRRVNFSHAVYLCCEALRCKANDISGLLERTLQPCRPNRSYPRPAITGNRISPIYVSAR